MQIYCTTCSKDKSTHEGRVAAIQRYQDELITSIYHKSQQDKKGFRILSGKYGLLSPTDEIPWYDQILLLHEVNNMIDLATVQLQHADITSVALFVKDPKENPEWQNYITTMVGACSVLNIELEIKLLN
ncbi:MAG: hypothetical protein JKY53_11725 [Flavobacteriales bacterium]|nr:hypothetical protein [Flavobacteriales bacterium]